MKIIDQTPFRDEKGQISPMDRVKATLKYGLSWYGKIEAQDKVIPAFEKQLERGYTLLRNVTLPNSEITLPLVLVGPAGILLINVCGEKGFFQAKGEDWGSVSNEQFTPGKVNYVLETLQYGKVLQRYLEKLGYKDMATVETLLVTADPGAHVETIRPAVRVIMSDALDRYAISMGQARGVLSVEVASRIADSIVSGRGIKKDEPAPAAPQEEEPAIPTYQLYDDGERTDFNSDAVSFSFDEPVDEEAADQQKAQKQQPRPQGGSKKASAKSKGKKSGGITKQQWMLLGIAGVFEIIILIVFFYLVLSNA